jgi:hypothetical protein
MLIIAQNKQPPKSMTYYIKKIAFLIFVSLYASYVNASIVVDGKLDEEAWKNAQVLDSFIITEPLTSEPSPYKTIAKIISDEQGLYIGVINHQPKAVPRVKTRFARDSWMAADRNVVIIDFDGNGKTAYEFTVSLSNSQQDGVVSEETKFQYDWDGTWYSATSEDGDYWINEIQIPWSTVPMTKAEGVRSIGVYVAQVIHSKKLRTSSVDASWQRSTFVSDLQKVEVATYSKQSIDVFPYITVQQNQIEKETDTKLGVDVFWKPTSNQQVSLAINPDFGQVESDNLVVNFSSIESFFSEKRSFFTENQALFTKQFSNGGHLVHTRRIGGGSDNEKFSTTDIDYALKYSHFGESIDFGGFIAQENSNSEATGRRYGMSHVEKKWSSFKLGHFATYVERPDLNREALVNALDMQFQLNQDSRLNGMLSFSDINDDDGDENGHSIDLSYTSTIDDVWRHDLRYIYMTDDYQLNDMGFMRRNDLKRLAGNHRYTDRDFKKESVYRDIEYKIEYNYRTNAANDRLESNIELGRNISFSDTSRLYLEVKRIFNSLDDRTMQDGNSFKREKRWGTFGMYDGVETKDIRHRFRWWLFGQELSGLAGHLSYEPTYNFTDNLMLNGRVAYTTNNQWLIWRDYQDREGGEIASFKEKRVNASVNLNWLIDSKQELRIKFEWIGIKAQFNKGYLPDSGGYLAATTQEHNSFELSNTALQLRYRYELAPLSNIFLVWSRGGNYELDALDEDYSGLLNNGWSEKTDDQFLVKVRYRF